MIKCNEYRLLISRYIDGNVNQAERLDAKRHLAYCLDCKLAFDKYVSIKMALQKNYSYQAIDPAIKHTWQKKTVKPRAIRWKFKIAAMIALGCALLSAFIIISDLRQKNKIPVVIETESSRILNTPLGSLVYYEEFAGKVVHSQYCKIRTSGYAQLQDSISAKHYNGSYESPLFCDNSFLDSRYEIIRNSSF
jgi:hypothetical protein